MSDTTEPRKGGRRRERRAALATKMRGKTYLRFLDIAACEEMSVADRSEGTLVLLETLYGEILRLEARIRDLERSQRRSGK